MSSSFVGAQRREIVDYLEEAFDNVELSCRSLAVSLEAPSGWGKSRLIQELFGRLSLRQRVPNYWPPSLQIATAGSGSGTVPVSATRKILRPTEFERPAGSLPGYLWLGVNCQSSTGELEIAQLQSQLEAHAIYLEAEWNALANFGERNSEAYRKWRATVEQEGALELASKALKLVGAEVPGLGLVAKIAESTRANIKRSRRLSRAIESPSFFSDANPRDLETALSSSLIRISRHIPIVIAVEDLPLADPRLLALLRDVFAQGSRILLLTTSIESTLEHSVASWLNTLGSESLTRIRTRRVGTESLDGMAIQPLSESERFEIVFSMLPGLEPHSADLLATRYENPLALLLTLELLDGAIRGVGDLIDEEFVRRIPRSVEQLYFEMFRSLPSEVQKALVAAAWVCPTKIHPLGRIAAWRWPVVLEALKAVAPNNETIAPEASRDLAPSWVRVDPQSGICHFHEDIMLDVAAMDPADCLYAYPRAQELLLAEVSRILTASSEEEVVVEPAMSVLVALYASGISSFGHNTALAAVARLDALIGAKRGDEESLKVWDLLPEPELSRSDRTNSVLLVGKLLNTQVLVRLGRADEALEMLTVMASRSAEIWGPEDPFTTMCLLTLASASLANGDVGGAIGIASEQFDAARTMGVGFRAHALGIWTRGLVEIGEGEKAIALLSEHSDLVVLGEGLEDGGFVQLMFLTLLAEAQLLQGSFSDALSTIESSPLREIGADLDRFGALAVHARVLRAGALTGLDLSEQALKELEIVQGPARGFLGDLDLQALKMRTQIGALLRRCGRPEEALVYLTALRSEVVSNLHPASPILLGVLMELGRTHRECYSRETAIDVFNEVAASGDLRAKDCSRFVFEAYCEIAGTHRLMGNPRLALESMAEVVDIAASRLGHRHPIALLCADQLAVCKLESGDPLGALRDLERLKDLAVEGRSAPLREIEFGILEHLGLAQLEMSKPSEALGSFESLLSFAVPGSESYLRLRMRRAVALRESGELREAEEELSESCTEMRASGFQAMSLEAGQQLGLTLLISCQSAAAVLVLDRVLSEQRRLFGDSAVEALLTRYFLGEAYASEGDLVEALSVLSYAKTLAEELLLEAHPLCLAIGTAIDRVRADFP